MTFLDDLLARLGLISDAGRRLTDVGPTTDGVELCFERDGAGLIETTGGHELELHAILDERHVPLAAGAAVRFDVMEADFLPGGGLDDLVTSLSGAVQVSDLPAGLSVRAFVEEFKRTLTAYEDTLLVVRREPDPLAGRPGTRRTHVFAWHRVVNDDVNAASELYAIFEAPGGVRAVSPVLSVGAAPAGVAVRLRGTLAGAPGVTATLGGRTATTGDGGDFVLDARLPDGDHVLRFARAGMEPVERTVRIALAADGKATAGVRDGTTTLATATTAAAADETSRLDLTPAADIPAVVHRLRGTVRWPDSPDPLPAGHAGTPLANRRVYVLPGGTRPATTRAWEALKRRPDVLRSAVTGADGAFEVPFVEFADGRQHLLWVERVAADGTEAPDLIVRTFTAELLDITGPFLTAMPAANSLARRDRLLVDHEESALTGGAVPRGPDVLEVIAGGAGQVLTRALAGADPLDVAAEKVVDDLDLAVLPLVPVYESPDARGPAAQAAADALAATATSTFADYTDIPPGAETRRVGSELGAVRLVTDAAGVAADLNLAGEAARVALLERTFVVRPDLGVFKALRVDQARWHADAVTLADTAFVTIDAGTPNITSRHLLGDVHPALAAPAPLLPALAGRVLYLGPGHGRWAANGQFLSSDMQHWSTDRGGYAANAGEDEVDAFLAAQTARIVEAGGARVIASRELYDVTRTGVRQTGAGFVEVGNPDFLRLWQQNAYYFLRSNAGGNAVGGVKNNAGANARHAHISANKLLLDLIFFPHTNGLEGNAETEPGHPPGTAHSRRGTMVEYLNVRHDPSMAHSSGNPLGFGLASRLSARLVERLRIRDRGVDSMAEVQGSAVGDLTTTFAHHRVGAGVAADRTDGPIAGSVPEPGLGAVKIPVALAEHAFHDNPSDSALLSRAWFRRLAAEGAAIACAAQLEASAPVTGAHVRKVLARTFGMSAALAARPAVAAVTPATVAADLQAVADPAATAPPGASLGAVASAAMQTARAFPRSALVATIRDALRTVAGWEATDAASVVDFWVGDAATAGRALTLPDAPATRAEAGAMVCSALGLTPAGVATAQARGLLDAVGVDPGENVYFPRVEALVLAAKLAVLRPAGVHRLTDAFLADEQWTRLETVPSGSLVTPLLRTAGTPFKTVGQSAVNGGVDGTRIVVTAAGRRTELTPLERVPRLVAGPSWRVDLPPSATPVAITLELRLRHRTAGWLSVGTKTVSVNVV